MLEIYYHIFGSFDPEWIIVDEEKQNDIFKQLREKEKKERALKLSGLYTRHSRFGANFGIRRSPIFDGK